MTVPSAPGKLIYTSIEDVMSDMADDTPAQLVQVRIDELDRCL